MTDSDDSRNGITRKDAEQAVHILLKWAGDNPDREGLLDTPKRVVRAYEEFFSGYYQNADDLMETVFTETENYHDIILLRDIAFESHCEHHLVPIIGKIHIGYIPDKKVIGISKLARLIDVFSKRLQLQERLTMQIAGVIEQKLKPRGVAVVVNSNHHCITTRGVYKPNSDMVTLHFSGSFTDAEKRKEFLSMIGL